MTVEWGFEENSKMFKWGFKAYYTLRKRGFDIYDFADSYREEEIDTESYKHITSDEREKIRLAFVRYFFFYNAQKKVSSINNRLSS